MIKFYKYNTTANFGFYIYLKIDIKFNNKHLRDPEYTFSHNSQLRSHLC